MWKEVSPKTSGKWPVGVRLPIVISVHHQSEESCVMFPDGQPDPRDFYERQYGGRRGAWRLLEIMNKHGDDRSLYRSRERRAESWSLGRGACNKPQ